MFEYKDRPGVLAAITETLARHKVNILDVRAPQDKETCTSLAVLMLDRPIDKAVVDEVKEKIGAIRAVAMSSSMPT